MDPILCRYDRPLPRSIPPSGTRYDDSSRPSLVLAVSIVVPVHNEAQNVELLYDQICQAMAPRQHTFEIVFVNDGSTDGSGAVLDGISAVDPRVIVVHLRRNYGQTAALSAGFEVAQGDAIVTMDADLQNDAQDIDPMLARLGEGYDLVHGWRKRRQDAYFTRRLPSQVANTIISWVTGFPVRDLGCTMKVMRRRVAAELNLYGELHRFIPLLAHWQGARCVEVATQHHPRLFGKTKYGLSRTFRVILDLITVKFLIQYSMSPMRLFGTFGFGCGAVAVVAAVAAVAMTWLGQTELFGNPLLYLSLFSGGLGIQFVSLGLLGEMNMRTYFESQKRKPYSIRETSRSAIDRDQVEELDLPLGRAQSLRPQRRQVA